MASDLGFHCLPMSPKWDARLIWVDASLGSIEHEFLLNLLYRYNCHLRNIREMATGIPSTVHMFVNL